MSLGERSVYVAHFDTRARVLQFHRCRERCLFGLCTIAITKLYGVWHTQKGSVGGIYCAMIMR